jgi:radical SAM superfamily enzyme YgiQ (UPF0313 family)
MKRRLYIAAVNNRYGNNVFLPYAAGLMWAYARQFPEIAEAYDLAGMLYLKEPVERVVERLEAPDVVAFSSYIWNHEYNKQLARAVKARWPRCATIVGGVQIVDDWQAVQDFDFAIYGEGEGAFADFLRARAGAENYAEVGSLIMALDVGVTPMPAFANPRRAEVPLETIPSPYLEGLFDEIVASRPDLQFQALQETNRGCPYSCTFCAWGAASLSKLRRFDEERIRAELEWFGTHKIGLLYNADANWGILPRDVALTEALVDCKRRHGYPQKFRAAFAKNSNDTVFAISKSLADAGMLKATTLALQSMDDGVLVNIKRKNIKYDKLAELSARYEAAGIATYAEIIVGLAGETFASYVEGLDRLLEAGQHDGISIYLCMLLPNTEMAAAEYRAAHGIEAVPMKALLYHGTPEPGVVEEIQETVVATATMPRAHLRHAVLYGWLLQALHAFGLTQHLARLIHEKRGVRYSAFYRLVFDWFIMDEQRDDVLGRELQRAAELWDAAVRGESWATVDARFGDVSWPPEELLFLRLACHSDAVYDALERFAHAHIWSEIVPYIAEQRARFIAPQAGDEETYAREAVWFGRKGPGRKLRLRDA